MDGDMPPREGDVRGVERPVDRQELGVLILAHLCLGDIL